MRWSCCRPGTKPAGYVAPADTRAGCFLSAQPTARTLNKQASILPMPLQAEKPEKKLWTFVEVLSGIVRIAESIPIIVRCVAAIFLRLCRTFHGCKRLAVNGISNSQCSSNRKTDMKNSLVLATVIAAAALVACGKKEEAPVVAPAVEAPAAAPAEVTPAVPAESTPPAAMDAAPAADAAAAGAAANAADASADAAKASEDAAKAAADAAANAAAPK